MTTRRNFLGGIAGILAAGFAPAAIGSGVLMPVRKIARVDPFDKNDPFGQRGFIDAKFGHRSTVTNEDWMGGGEAYTLFVHPMTSAELRKQMVPVKPLLYRGEIGQLAAGYRFIETPPHP